jgi:hypothetical protein
MFRLQTRQLTGVPARDRFPVAFALKQFLATFHLGVASILDLEPRRPLCLRRVRPGAMLCHDPFQIQFADALKQRLASLLDVLDVSHPRSRADQRQQPPQFMLSVCQSLCPQILPIRHQQIEREEARLTLAKEEIAELQSSAFVETHDLPIDDGLAGIG